MTLLPHKLPNSRLRQRGYALIVFVALLTTAALTLAAKVISNNAGNQIARDQVTAAALAQAREALIGFAITYPEIHSSSAKVLGYLPCPDTAGTAEIGGEGAATGSCGSQNVSAIGKFPWKTLNLPPLRGGDGECLWYAVSGTYKYNPPTDLLNWDTNGQFQVYAPDGTTLLTPADNQAVAVIFAPGSTTSGQDRKDTTAAAPVCGGNYTASNFLDTVGTINNATVSPTASANTKFRIGNPALSSGDRIAFITRQDLWNAIKRRQDLLNTLDVMTRRTAECIAKFGTTNNMATNKSLPWPAQISLPNYATNTDYNDHDNLLVGRVPYRVNTARGQTGNTISPSPYYLLKDDNPSGSAYCTSGWANIYPWWNNWKDHLFYAISDRYKPNNVATTACASGSCVSVNGTGLYAAVVIFAGDRLAGQIRSDKSVVAAYLEGRNPGNINGINTPGHDNYQIDASDSTFNDIVYCIKADLSVVKGSAAGCP